MDHHGIPMPPDPDSPLKGKIDQMKKIDAKLNEISSKFFFQLPNLRLRLRAISHSITFDPLFRVRSSVCRSVGLHLRWNRIAQSPCSITSN